MREIGVGFLGAGVVGAGALDVLLSKREKLAGVLGAELVVEAGSGSRPEQEASRSSLPPGS